MTRVILTNKKTGQELPEAELVNVGPSTYAIKFDGTRGDKGFYREEWDCREVRQFRNGDVLRRKDRDDTYVRYMFVPNVHDFGGRWLEIQAGGKTREIGDPRALNDPEWEVV